MIVAVKAAQGPSRFASPYGLSSARRASRAEGWVRFQPEELGPFWSGLDRNVRATLMPGFVEGHLGRDPIARAYLRHRRANDVTSRFPPVD